MESLDGKNTDQIVAVQIAMRFLAKGLVPEQLLGEFQRQLADGAMTEEDWRLFAEKTLEIQIRESKNVQS